ncbi:MAG: hypothetical protein JXN61_15715 [Sedimentisphaerales bacterium]|nr:hypothetical protein [Sedimentisphaerales bacterium]
MSSDFSDLLERLVSARVDFVLVGGFAGVVHGCTYVTQDIDICCDFSPANLLLLQETVSDLHPVHRMTPNRIPLQLTEESCRHLKNLYLDTDIGQLDCLSFIDGVGDYEKVKRASEPIEVRRMLLPVLGLDGLIKAKKAMNRPQDQQAVVHLEALKKLKEK